MPLLRDRINALFDELATEINTAWPGLTEVFRGWPNLELSMTNVPCAMMAVTSFTSSAETISATVVPVTIVGLFPLPSDTSLNLLDERLKLADDLIARLESKFVWADGDGVNSYVTEVTVSEAPMQENEISRIVIDFQVEFHCKQGT